MLNPAWLVQVIQIALSRIRVEDRSWGLSAEIGSAYDTMDLHTSYYLNHMTVNPLVQYYLIPSISATHNRQAFCLLISFVLI